MTTLVQYASFAVALGAAFALGCMVSHAFASRRARRPLLQQVREQVERETAFAGYLPEGRANWFGFLNGLGPSVDWPGAEGGSAILAIRHLYRRIEESGLYRKFDANDELEREPDNLIPFNQARQRLRR